MKIKKFENECYIIEKETDVLNYVTKSSTIEQRKKFDIGNVFINAIVCKKCGSYIRSKNRHDFKWCKCKSVAVDGGSWYMKRLGKEEDYFECSEMFHKLTK